MIHAIDQFDIPKEIKEKVKNGTDGVKADILFDDEDPKGFSIVVKDIHGQVIFTCARPCPKL